jgi:hypothetical protein
MDTSNEQTESGRASCKGKLGQRVEGRGEEKLDREWWRVFVTQIFNRLNIYKKGIFCVKHR